MTVSATGDAQAAVADGTGNRPVAGQVGVVRSTVSSGPTQGRGNLTRAWPLLLCGLVVLVVIGVVARHQNPPPRADPAPTSIASSTPPQPVTTPDPTPSATSPDATTSATEPVATTLAQPLRTGGTAWQVVARTRTDVWVIDPSTGRALRTPIPNLGSAGAVSFLAGPGWVMVRPVDRADGYLIRDGLATTALSGLLTAGPALPGTGGRDGLGRRPHWHARPGRPAGAGHRPDGAHRPIGHHRVADQ